MKTKLILSLFLGVFLFSGCKTKEVIRYVPVPTVSTVHDSVYVSKSDSIYIHQKGDTVFVKSFQTLYRDRNKVIHDSISIPFEVKVPVDVIKIKEVKQKDFFWYTGFVLLSALGLIAGYKALKFFKVIA